MKQKEHISNYIGSIILMFSVLFIASLSPQGKNSTDYGNSLKSDQLSTNNNTGITIEPLTHSTNGNIPTHENQIEDNKTDFVSLINFTEHQVNLQIKQTALNYCNLKYKLVFILLNDSLSENDDSLIA
ncbi:MAG: hypothetical protein C0599_13725 [Salinivirgaceae bacterium]|nr:MAG: hypothetical protein C0599_13725 [Salinivirgaceae bacterium]